MLYDDRPIVTVRATGTLASHSDFHGFLQYPHYRHSAGRHAHDQGACPGREACHWFSLGGVWQCSVPV